jgi:uncharacterized protein with PQ loop repeat
VSITDAIGWIAALSSACVAVPQGLRIVATRSVAGISAMIWQMTVLGALAWMVHGLIAGRPQIIWPNALLTITSAWVLAMVCRAEGGSLGRAFGLPVLGAGIAVGTELAFGPIAFGLVIFIPSAIGLVSQLVTIQKAADTTGVSLAGLVMALACQLLWLTYAIPAGEIAVIFAATPTTLLLIANVVALQTRRAQAAARQPVSTG